MKEKEKTDDKMWGWRKLKSVEDAVSPSGIENLS